MNDASGELGPSRDVADADWHAAADDADVGSVEVVLYPLQATGKYGAMHFPPDLWPHEHDDAFAYDDTHLAELYELRHQHVLGLDETLTGTKRTLVLRHEAEHVAQHEANAPGAEVALRLAASLAGLEAPWLYLAMPHERDADAATTRFRVEHEIEATPDDLEGEDRFLYSAPWPPAERETLPLRLLAFTLFYPDDFDLACTSNQYLPSVDPAELIEQMIQGGAEARTQMRNAFAGFLEDLCDHGVGQEEWDAMSRSAQTAFSDNLRQRVVDAEAEVAAQLAEIID